MLIRKILLLVFSGLIYVVGGCQQDFSPFYYSSDGDFSFLRFNNLDVSRIPQVSNGKSYNLIQYSFKKDGISYSSAYYPILWDSLGIANEYDILIDNMVQGAADNSNGILETRTKILYNSFPGREYIIRYYDGRILKGRIYIINRQVYMMEASCSSGSQISDLSVNAFLNSFTKGRNESPIKDTLSTIDYGTQPKSSKKDTLSNSPELSLKVIESYLLSNKQTIEFDLTQREWKYTGTLNLEGYGTGYQYYNQRDSLISQIICYVDKKALLYVPSSDFGSKIVNEIRQNYTFSKSQRTGGLSQDVFRKGLITIYITKGPKEMITFAWNVSN